MTLEVLGPMGPVGPKKKQLGPVGTLGPVGPNPVAGFQIKKKSSLKDLLKIPMLFPLIKFAIF